MKLCMHIPRDLNSMQCAVQWYGTRCMGHMTKLRYAGSAEPSSCLLLTLLCAANAGVLSHPLLSLHLAFHRKDKGCVQGFLHGSSTLQQMRKNQSTWPMVRKCQWTSPLLPRPICRRRIIPAHQLVFQMGGRTVWRLRTSPQPNSNNISHNTVMRTTHLTQEN